MGSRVKLKGTLILGLSLSVSACANSVFFPSDSFLSNENLDDSAAAFRDTLYPIVIENCSNCHGSTVTPKFAVKGHIQSSHDALNPDAQTYINFSDPRASNLISKVRRGHNCWSGDCNADGDVLYDAILAWKEARGVSGSEVRGYATAALTIPADISSPQLLEFDLSGINGSEVPNGTRLELTVSQLDDEQYLLLDPTLYSGDDLYVNQMRVYINEIKADASAWEILDLIVSAQPTSGNEFATGTGPSANVQIGLGIPEGQLRGPGVDTITIAFEFIGQPQDPAEIRFNRVLQLIANDCANCHRNTRNTDFGVPVQAFGNFIDEFEFERQYGNYSNGDPRYLVIAGDAQNSGLYRSIAHRSVTNFPEYDPGGQADGADMEGIGSNAQRAAWAAIIRDWIDNMP